MEDPALLLWSQDWLFPGFDKLPHQTRCNWYDFKDDVFWELPELGYDVDIQPETGTHQLVDYKISSYWWE